MPSIISPIISEILKVKVGPSFTLDSVAFASLRDIPIKRFGVKEQFYGLCTDESNTLLWVIQWPKSVNPADAAGSDMQAFRESVKTLDVDSRPLSWYLPFNSYELVRPALAAPICQLCSIQLKEVDKGPLAHSLHKTFTDCYETPGFTGGHWATALNDNRRHYYYLGWQTREFHDEYAKTKLFDEEMDKLIPHMAEGTTNYMKMISHFS